MAPKKSTGVPALRINPRVDADGVQTTPNVWHMVGEHPGLWHPSIPVPVDVVDGTEEWAKPLDHDKGCPLELVYITEDEADAGREAFAKATGASLDALLARLHKNIPVVPGGFEAQRLAAEHQNALATVEHEE